LQGSYTKKDSGGAGGEWSGFTGADAGERAWVLWGMGVKSRKKKKRPEWEKDRGKKPPGTSTEGKDVEEGHQ